MVVEIGSVFISRLHVPDTFDAVSSFAATTDHHFSISQVDITMNIF